MTKLSLAILALAMFGQAPAGQDAIGRLTGVVTDASARLPGVKVTADGIGFHESVLVGEQGTYVFRTIPPGAYSVTAELPGFQKQTKRITIAIQGTRRLDFALALGLLQDVDYVVPDAATAYKNAVAVAHLRIERTEEPQNCVDSLKVHHLAAVLSIAKGDLPPSVWFTQEDTGWCFDKGQLVRAGGIYRAGEEYIAFLAVQGESFVSLAGRWTIFRLENGRVSDDDYPPIRKGMTVEAAWAALKRTAR